MGGACSTIGELHAGFLGHPVGKRSLGNLSVDGRIILTRIFKKYVREAWTGLTWLRTGTGDRLL